MLPLRRPRSASVATATTERAHPNEVDRFLTELVALDETNEEHPPDLEIEVVELEPTPGRRFVRRT